MAVITEEAIRELAAFKGEEAPVTTCYLDVDGRRFVRHQDYERELDVMMKAAREKVNGSESVAKDLRRIDEYIRGGIDRSATRGVAIFACSAHDLWQVVSLPVPVRNRIVVNSVPAVGQLEGVVQNFERFGVLLADKQRARMFVFEMGVLTDRSEMLEELPRDYDQRGHSDKGAEREKQHVEALTAQHLRHAAQAAFEMYQRGGFERFTIGAPDAIARELESYLHPYLKERLCSTNINVVVSASLDDIRHAALDLEAEVDRKRDAEAVSKLRDAMGEGQKGVVGLEAVLRALHDHRVDRLLVSAGYIEAGWHCASCDALATVGRTCPVCNAPEMDHIDDVVEEAVEVGLVQGVKVAICEGNADLDVLGRIGALLRY